MFNNDIRSMDINELKALTGELGQPAYRAEQLFTWIHRRMAQSFDEMTNLPLAFRRELETHCCLRAFRIVDKAVSKADNATKYLFALENNTIIESVYMRHSHGTTLCVSTQAGCRMGCAFCASTAGGLDRNLTPGEMCAQVYAVQQDTDTRVDGVVMMGCGEPLDNFDASVRFISLISHPGGQDMGRRHITLSTCGLVPRIYDLAALRLPITLAVSLHAPNGAIRRTLMPVARKYPIHTLLEACDHYADTTHRRVTFEYALVKGVNDSDACARALGVLLAGKLCHVNLIPVNDNTAAFLRSDRADIFARRLSEKGIPVTVRKSLGGDINAACGQLRGRHMGIL